MQEVKIQSRRQGSLPSGSHIPVRTFFAKEPLTLFTTSTSTREKISNLITGCYNFFLTVLSWHQSLFPTLNDLVDTTFPPTSPGCPQEIQGLVSIFYAGGRTHSISIKRISASPTRDCQVKCRFPWSFGYHALGFYLGFFLYCNAPRQQAAIAC